MKEMIGACKFCHQTTMLMVPNDATPDMVEHEATMNCTCKLSKEYQEKQMAEESLQMSIDAARASIDELFDGDDYEGLRRSLKGCIEAIAKMKIKKVTVNVTSKIKATIQLKDDAILVTRTQTEKFDRETTIGH